MKDKRAQLSFPMQAIVGGKRVTIFIANGKLKYLSNKKFRQKRLKTSWFRLKKYGLIKI